MSQICPFCKSVVRNPVTMPCCKVILCRACAFKGLTRNGKKCWFTPCERVKISYDELKKCVKPSILPIKEKKKDLKDSNDNNSVAKKESKIEASHPESLATVNTERAEDCSSKTEKQSGEEESSSKSGEKDDKLIDDTGQGKIAVDTRTDEEEKISQIAESSDLNDNSPLVGDEVPFTQSKQSVSASTSANGMVEINGANILCYKCGKHCRNITYLKNHLVSHYYPVFYKVLPDSKPFPCPECQQNHRDRTSLARHFALTHKKIFELTDITLQHYPFSEETDTRDASTNINQRKKCVAAKAKGMRTSNTKQKCDQDYSKVSDIITARLDNILKENSEKSKKLPSPADQIINEKLEEMSKTTSQFNKDTTLLPTSSAPLVEDHEELNSSGKITNKTEVVINSNNNCDNKDFDDSDTDWEIIDEWNDNSEANDEILEKSCNPMRNSQVEDDARNGRLEAECPPGQKALVSSDKELSSAVSVKAQEYKLNSIITLNNESMGGDRVSGVSAFIKTNIALQKENLVDPHHEKVENVEVVSNDTWRPELTPSSPAISNYSDLGIPQTPSGTSLKFERQDSNFLPSGLYGLLFLDVEVVLDGDSDPLQVTQLGCQTYFSNGELWSSFFTAVVPKEMTNYMNHTNSKLCPTLMSLLRLTFSHFNYQLVRPDGSFVECETHDQAILRFAKYVKKVTDLVDGIVFVITRPELVLPFLQSLELDSNNTVVGMINLTEVFSDSFPHSSRTDDVAAIYKLIFSEECLPRRMDCESKSKVLVKIIEKLLPKVDYEKFVQPYGKLFSLDSGHQNSNIGEKKLMKISAGELGLCESFSPEVEAISKLSGQNQVQPRDKLLNEVLIKEKSERPMVLNEDFVFGVSSPDSSVKQKVVKVESTKMEVDLDSSVEYLEPEHDWDKFKKMENIHISGFITPDLAGSRELLQKADFAPDKLRTPEPQGNVDIDTEDEHDANSLSGAADCFVPQLRLSKDLTSTDINNIDEDVIVPTGPVCVCDKFETLQQISGDLAGLCKECRSCQVKMICHLVSSSKVKTIVARIEDVDGVVSDKCVKFIPSPFLLQQKKSAPYSQIRKVFLNNYILLCIEGNPNMNLDLEENSLIGLCQVWLGTKVEDLEYHDDVSLICEDIKILDDGSLVLLCSTELVLRRPLPLMVSNISQYLHIKPGSRIVTASKTGMVSVTCKSGTTGYLPSLGDNVGTATTDVDEDLVDQIVKLASISSQPSLPYKRKATSETEKPQSKKLKMTSPMSKDSALATLQCIKAKHALVTKAPLKFGIKKAFKASPLIRAEAFTDQSNESSDGDSGSPSPPSLAPINYTQGSEPPSKLKQQEVIDLVGISGLPSNTNLKTSQGKSLPGRKRPPPFSPYPPGQLIPTVINIQSAETFSQSQRPSLPVLNQTIPGFTIPVSLPSNFPTYSPTKYLSPGQPLGFSPPKIPHVSLPKPSPAACKNCFFPSLQSMRPEPCPSCPFFKLVLNSDLILPPDKPTFGSVRFQGFGSDQGRGFQLFAKVYTENGILKMPQSLNMLPSDNPHPIPKHIFNGEVTVTFLNTALQPTPLKAGQIVGMGQIIYIMT